MQETVLPILVLGFLLGMKHSLDVDHLAAVTTLIAGQRNRWRSVLVGMWWGLGHSATLLLLGGAILLFGLTFPPAVSLALEFGVGLMLIALGARVLLRLRKGGTLHLHTHEHAGRLHIHPHIHPSGTAHAHEGGAADPRDPGAGHRRDSGPAGHHDLAGVVARTPKTSLLVGMVHGVAGSAGLTLVLLPTMPTKAMGVVYLGVFGAGSILGMSLATLLVSLPLGMAWAGGRSGRVVSFLAGGLGVAVGLVLAFQTGGELLRL
jgi:hypothetical protein